ncbi:MAG: hypothetical protein MJY97_00665 [Bacteroidales bacterium]|nr:hypothetical protein [Bacteroidales bacterium]
MTVGDLINMFLRLEMAEKEKESEFAFDTGREGESPFAITGVKIDEEGDICLLNDARSGQSLSAAELAEELRQFDNVKMVYFISIDRDGSSILYDIKDGGTHDRMNPDIRMVSARNLAERLKDFNPDSIPYFESGTINFTVNSVYEDEQGCLCLESNEIEELDNYTVGLLLDELSSVGEATMVYLYDDESKEYYGIYLDEYKIDQDGNPWINVR